MSDDPLLFTLDKGVLHLVLNRPAKRNALSAALRNRLIEELTAARADDAVGAVLISGAGDTFCAGFDLGELAEASDPATVFADAQRYHHSLHTFPKPTIAAIAGSAVAGGLDLALLCDLRMATPDATLGQPQIRHGIPAAYDLLAGVVGDATAKDLCLTGRTVDGTEALSIGLVHRLTAAGDLLAGAMQLAGEIAGLPGATMMKEQFVAGQPDLFAGP